MGDKELLKKEVLDPDLIPHLSRGQKGGYIVRHPLYWSSIIGNPFEETEHNYIENQKFRNQKSDCDELLKTKKYVEFIYSVPEPTQIQWFYKLYKDIYRKLGENRYYSLLGEVLIDVEFHYLIKKIYSELIYYGSNPQKMMDINEMKLFKKLPYRIQIFRGVSSDTEIVLSNMNEFIGNSWTIDKEKSIWFSKRVDRKYKYILSTEISKNQVLSYFNRSSEGEILVDYTKLDFSKINFEEVNQDE
jgi:hypothetical protein